MTMSSMSWFTHVRRRFWDPECYTEAQAQELRALRGLYSTHLASAFGAAFPDAFRLRTEGNDYYPAYTSTQFTAPMTPPLPPSAPVGASPFRPFAETLLSTLAVFEARRAERWYGRGHPNDPTRLFSMHLRQVFNGFTHAACSETTLQQVTALRHYLNAVQNTRLFRQEKQDHGSMTVLLHNLATPLDLLEKRLQHELRSQSAREHFDRLKDRMVRLLSTSAHYLFYALAAKDRTQLPFSLLNIQARTVDRQLQTALATREGLLLQQWMHTPTMVQALLPQRNPKSLGASVPVSLLGTDTPTPLLDEKGQAHPFWLGFLHQDPVVEAQCSPRLKPLPTGICPLLLPDDNVSSTTKPALLAACIRLHGFMGILAQYQAYLQDCWQLAGFGGDHCLYEQIVEAVVSLLSELQVFQQVFLKQLTEFQAQLAEAYRQALDTSCHAEWQNNYRQATLHYEQLQAQIKACEEVLKGLQRHAQDTADRSERRQMAAEAYQRLVGAADFLAQVREQLGLPPRKNYPGLQAPTPSIALPSADSMASSLDGKPMGFEQVVMTLLPEPQEAAALSQLCTTTPTAPPRSFWRGTYQRYCYLQAPESLQHIAAGLLHLRLNAQTLLTPENKLLMASLKTRVEEEQARIRHLRQPLWWPFHRASLRFFDAWQKGLEQAARYLSTLSQLSSAPTPSAERLPRVSTQRLQRLLAPSAGALIETKSALTVPAPTAPALLSIETKAKIAQIHFHYNSMTLQERAHFDTWQQQYFKGSLWDRRGMLQTGLSESDGQAVLAAWKQAILQNVKETATMYYATRHATKAEARAEQHHGAQVLR